MKITITNTFHNSSVNVIVPNYPFQLTSTQVKRVEKNLCGIPNCRCGSMWSMSNTEIEGSDRHHFEPLTDNMTGRVLGAELVEN